MAIYRVGVVGAGTMGAQIAQVVSFAGIPVVLTDVNQAIAERGMARVREIYQARVVKGKLTPEQLEERMLLVRVGEGVNSLREVDLVVEAVSEDLRLKQHLFQGLDAACSPGTILTSNTSALSISALGSATRRPGKVAGLHFFNPASAMPLVEVIPGLLTDQGTVDDLVSFAQSIRKAPIVVKDCAGFLVNRLLMPYLNEAVLCLQEGAASMQAIDQAMREFGMPVGPFTLLDQLGLDIAAEVARLLHQAYGPRMAPAALLEALVKSGRLGIKSGRGFYDYGGAEAKGMVRRGGPASTDVELAQLVQEVVQESSQRVTISSRDRLLLAMVNEAVTLLQEGVASARDIDLAMVSGTGFPQDQEGPLHYADRLGLEPVLRTLEDFTRALGMRFWPAPLLRRMVDAGLTGRQVGRGFFTYEA